VSKNMKKLFILMSLAVSLFFVAETNAQTKIVFAKGASSKTMTITVPANSERLYSVAVRKDQVINIGAEGDIFVSKTEEFPVISLNLTNGEEDVDQTQDGEGYLSILTGRTATYIFNVSNSSNRVRTFTLKVSVTNDRADFAGGTDEP